MTEIKITESFRKQNLRKIYGLILYWRKQSEDSEKKEGKDRSMEKEKVDTKYYLYY